MNDYEILLMLDPDLADERQTEIVTRAQELVTNAGGNWLSHDVWGRRRLAYEIDHKPEGSYHLLQFDAESATLDEVTRRLKITDGVMRHMAARRVKGGTRAAPPPLPPSEAVPRYEREERHAAPAVEVEAKPVEAETAEDVSAAEEYPEPTVESEAPEAPEEEN